MGGTGRDRHGGLLGEPRGSGDRRLWGEFPRGAAAYGFVTPGSVGGGAVEVSGAVGSVDGDHPVLVEGESPAPLVHQMVVATASTATDFSYSANLPLMSTPSAAAIYAEYLIGPRRHGARGETPDPGCRKLADHLGWTVAEEYVDNDLSAFSGKRQPRV